MSLRKTLRKNKTVIRRRWIVKRDEENNIKEVKMIYDPEHYKTLKNSKPMVGDRVLLKILEDEKEKNNRKYK